MVPTEWRWGRYMIPVVPHEEMPEVSKGSIEYKSKEHVPMESFVTTLIDWTFVLMTWTKLASVEVMCFDEVMWLVLRWVNVVICGVWCYVMWCHFMLVQYYKVLLQYYSVLQSTTPVLIRTTKYYSSTMPVVQTKYYSSTILRTTPVVLHTTNFHSSTTLYYSSAIKYYKVLPQYYYKVLLQWRLNFTKYCACHEVTLEPRQMLRLPRKMTRLLNPPEIWNVISNAETIRAWSEHGTVSPQPA